MSVDLRTRTDGPRETVDPTEFFEHDLPAALHARRDPDALGMEGRISWEEGDDDRGGR